MTDLRSALESAFEAEEKLEPVAADIVAPAIENEPEQKAQDINTDKRNRDASGRFTQKASDGITEQKEAVEPDINKETQGEVKPIKAPSSWKPAAQEAYLKAERGEALTPEEVRILTTEANRRESDFHRGVEEFKTHAQRAKTYEAVTAPYQQTFNQLGVDAPTAIGYLLKADSILRYSDPATKSQYFAQLASEYGIDINQVQSQPQPDPQINYLMQQLNELRSSQQQWHNSIQQQERARSDQELSRFESAGNVHFDAVRNDMADLLESGKASSLEDAYEKAVWMNPDIRKSLIEQQRLDANKKALEESQSIRAKSAAVSVKGSSPSAGGVKTNEGDLRSLIASQFE